MAAGDLMATGVIVSKHFLNVTYRTFKGTSDRQILFCVAYFVHFVFCFPILLIISASQPRGRGPPSGHKIIKGII